MKLKDIGEFGFIELLVREYGLESSGAGARRGNPRVARSIGDDTSATLQKSNRLLLTTIDTLVEGTHFSLGYCAPQLLGRRALAVSLSDIAAMGGQPLFYLVSLTLPRDTDILFLGKLYKGMDSLARESNVTLIGGNTAAVASGGLSITTTVLGEVDKSEVVYRKGAKAGDIIYVTGSLGGSAYGLKLLKKWKTLKRARGLTRLAMKRHLDPIPRLDCARKLASRHLVTSMIDLSDGLVSDLTRISEESRVGAVVEYESVPLDGALARDIKGKKARAGLVLAGGEDYELLFTADKSKSAAIRRVALRAGISITPIGRITKAGPVRVVDSAGKEVSLKSTGYDHFKG